MEGRKERENVLQRTELKRAGVYIQFGLKSFNDPRPDKL